MKARDVRTYGDLYAYQKRANAPQDWPHTPTRQQARWVDRKVAKRRAAAARKDLIANRRKRKA